MTHKGIIILRIESSILYFNAENILDKIISQSENSDTELKLIILDLSASSYVDVAGSKMLLLLSKQLQKKNISLKLVEALSGVRDILRKQGVEEITGHISRRVSINDTVQEFMSGKNEG